MAKGGRCRFILEIPYMRERKTAKAWYFCLISLLCSVVGVTIDNGGV